MYKDLTVCKAWTTISAEVLSLLICSDLTEWGSEVPWHKAGEEERDLPLQGSDCPLRRAADEGSPET